MLEQHIPYYRQLHRHENFNYSKIMYDTLGYQFLWTYFTLSPNTGKHYNLLHPVSFYGISKYSNCSAVNYWSDTRLCIVTKAHFQLRFTVKLCAESLGTASLDPSNWRWYECRLLPELRLHLRAIFAAGQGEEGCFNACCNTSYQPTSNNNLLESPLSYILVWSFRPTSLTCDVTRSHIALSLPLKEAHERHYLPANVADKRTIAENHTVRWLHKGIQWNYTLAHAQNYAQTEKVIL
jgi:hypothetical protein